MPVKFKKMQAKTPISIFWHRRDVRLHDNAGLMQALQSENPVLPLFIFDTEILDKLENKKDLRVQFIHLELEKIKNELEKNGSSLLVKYGKPSEIWEQLLKEFDIKAVFTNRDYEPYAQNRDKTIFDFLAAKNIPFKGYKDHVIFEKNEVSKADGLPYTVFTPYSKKWRAALTENTFAAHESEKLTSNFLKTAAFEMPTLADMGFEASTFEYPEKAIDLNIVKKYDENRNFPAQRGTTKLGLHLRFGTLSIRELARKTNAHNQVYINELIWRDFYQTILYHFPHVVGNAFRAKYDKIPWRNAPEDFEAWCNGQTGYPIVDAGMRELNATGFMHNRVRMIVASFLTKHLLLDWRLGEAYFAEKLLDFDLASNNGGWQWASGSGCDAAPYFRVFNPYTQTENFDKDLKYVRKWVPEFETKNYVKPIVEHKFGRQRAIDTYKEALNS